MWLLQGLQGCHGHKQLHGIDRQRQEEFEGLVKGQRILIEYVENDAHGG